MHEIGPDTLQWQWRDLFWAMHEYEGDRWREDVIGPWVDQHPGVISELHVIGAAGNHRVRVAELRGDYSALEGLYGLSRVLDVLIAPFQPASDDPAASNWVTGKPWWTGRLPDPAALPMLAAAIGAVPISEQLFHPFFHEIVAVEPADDPETPAELVAEVWPGYLAGSMLLVRAGVTVRAGRAVMDPAVAARSCLFWAWWRRNRVVQDLSHGWGANSQWATDFRRDYLDGGVLHYNVDACKHRPYAADNELSETAARDLLRHRCSIREDLGYSQAPWSFSFTERRP